METLIFINLLVIFFAMAWLVFEVVMRLGS